MTAERWLPVVGWEGLYEVSDLGRVRRVRKTMGTQCRVLRGSMDRHGYPTADLSDRGRRRNAKVHRLVAEAFLGPTPEGMEVRHLNGDPADSRLVNLVYGTHAENMRDMIRHGRTLRDIRTHCPQGHPYDDGNTYIDHRGARNCRKCMAARERLRQRQIREEMRAAGQLYFYNVRQWGRANGWAVKETGRISQGLLDAYDEAHRSDRSAAA